MVLIMNVKREQKTILRPIDTKVHNTMKIISAMKWLIRSEEARMVKIEAVTYPLMILLKRNSKTKEIREGRTCMLLKLNGNLLLLP